MHRYASLFLSLVMLTLSACGDEGSGYTISDGTLSGELDGVPWTFVQGETDSYLSDEEEFFTSLYPETYEACDTYSLPDTDLILLGIPKEPGEYPLGLTQSVTFVVGDSDNYIATSGLLVVEEITADTIKAGLYAVYGSTFEVDGHFTVQICE